MSQLTVESTFNVSHKSWTIALRRQWNGIAADCISPDGEEYRTLFCFQTQESALSYAKSCIDYFLCVGHSVSADKTAELIC